LSGELNLDIQFSKEFTKRERVKSDTPLCQERSGLPLEENRNFSPSLKQPRTTLKGPFKPGPKPLRFLPPPLREITISLHECHPLFHIPRSISIQGLLSSFCDGTNRDTNRGIGDRPGNGKVVIFVDGEGDFSWVRFEECSSLV
jgi:hypothetical protein